MKLKKIKVLFPYVEAGFGHIMPMKSIEQTFRRKYGDRVEVISSVFFTETGNKNLKKYEQMLANQVRSYNRHPFKGHVATFVCELVGAKLSSFGSIHLAGPIARREGFRHMKELSPDIVFSTHWVTNYFAENIDPKPVTVMYCPDAQLNKLFEYHADLNMMSMPYGYEKALRKRQYNIHNMKMVPFLIRNEAFDIPDDKKLLRRELGLPEDNFTIVLAEGGYGIGRMGAITERLCREHLKVTVVPVCGKNEKLYGKLSALAHQPEVTLIPYKFTNDILKLEAASDIFCGKSGNILAESTFFGNPSIVTNCSNMIEHNIADHYINTVGSAMKQLCARKVVKMLVKYINNPSLLDPYREAARNYRSHFGSEGAADELWKKITQVFPPERWNIAPDGGNEAK